MAEVSAGSQTAVIGTEHSLYAGNTFGTFQLKVGVANLANDEVLELRVKTKARAAESAVAQEYCVTIKHAQDNLIVSSPPVLASAVEFTLKQTAGTGRAFPWSINSP